MGERSQIFHRANCRLRKKTRPAAPLPPPSAATAPSGHCRLRRAAAWQLGPPADTSRCARRGSASRPRSHFAGRRCFPRTGRGGSAEKTSSVRVSTPRRQRRPARSFPRLRQAGSRVGDEAAVILRDDHRHGLAVCSSRLRRSSRRYLDRDQPSVPPYSSMTRPGIRVAAFTTDRSRTTAGQTNRTKDRGHDRLGKVHRRGSRSAMSTACCASPRYGARTPRGS